MRIWEMRAAEGSMLFRPFADLSLDCIQTFDGRPKLDGWEEMELVEDVGDEGKPLPAIAGVAPLSLFALNGAAVEALRDLLSDDVDLLPAAFQGESYWIMYVRSVLDCVDYERSGFTVFPNGRIAMFDSFFFRKEAVGSRSIFKIKDRPRGFCFVSEAFRERALEIAPEDLKFILVWDSELKHPIDLPFVYTM